MHCNASANSASAKTPERVSEHGQVGIVLADGFGLIGV